MVGSGTSEFVPCAVPSILHGVGYAINVEYQGEYRKNIKCELLEHPVLNIPSIVAPGAGSIYINGY